MTAEPALKELRLISSTFDMLSAVAVLDDFVFSVFSAMD
jgi:hypothetical protein